MSRHRNRGPPLCRVFIGNLGDRGTQPELEGAFSCFGPLRSVWIARNPPGFAFVEFEDPDHALEAVSALDGSILCGCPVRVELAHTNSRSSDRTPPSPGRCYACGERGHYARDCYLQYADVDPENELDHSFAHTREGLGNISELCLDPETYEGCDWNTVTELMGIQPRTRNQRNRHDDGSFSSYLDPPNTAQLPDSSGRSWQSDWYDSPPQRLWFDSPPQQRGHIPPQQNRNYTPQQSNWDGSLPQHNMSNRARQQNWAGRPSQRVWIDSPLQPRDGAPLQQSRSNRPLQRYLGDTPEHRYPDDILARHYLDDTPEHRHPDITPHRYPDVTPAHRYPDVTPAHRYRDVTPAHRYRDDTPAHRYRDDTPAHRYLDDTPPQRRSNRPPQRRGTRPPQQNRSDRSQQKRTSGGTASHSSVSNKLNDTSDDIKCAICLDTEEDPEMKYLPCGHGFHTKCCNDWLSVNSLCPVCRTSVASQSTNVQDNPERNADSIPTFFIGSVWFG